MDHIKFVAEREYFSFIYSNSKSQNVFNFLAPPYQMGPNQALPPGGYPPPQGAPPTGNHV